MLCRGGEGGDRPRGGRMTCLFLFFFFRDSTPPPPPNTDKQCGIGQGRKASPGGRGTKGLSGPSQTVQLTLTFQVLHVEAAHLVN
jgi:hypothetical protein